MKHLRLAAEPLARTLSVAVLAVMVMAIGIGTTHNDKNKNEQPVALAAAAVKTTTTAAKVKNPAPSATSTKKRASRAFRRVGVVAPKSMALRQIWLKGLLYEAGFRGKGLKTAWAIAMRESHGNPSSHNKNRHTGDNSYGLFQINMIGGMGYERRQRFGLKSNSELLNPLTNARIAYRMTKHGKDWSSWGLGNHAYNGNRNEPAYRKWLKHYPSK